MTQIDGDFFERPGSSSCAVSEVVTKIMKRHTGNTSPFFLVSLLLYLHPEMLNPTLGEMIWPSPLT
jgi:hypothetical protein